MLKERLEGIRYLSPLQYNLIIYLSKCGAKKREELVRELNTPRTTLYDNLEKLEKQEIIFKSSTSNGKRGRPPVYWQIKQALNLKLFNVIFSGKKIGIVGSGEYKKKEIVIQKLEQIIDKQKDIVVSGHSPRNKKFDENGKKYYDNVDNWAEDWANERCTYEPIIHPALENNRKEYFRRNKKIALESKELIIFINRHQYQSGAWNTLKHFLEKPNFNYNNLTVYDEFGIKLRLDELPEWCQNKIEENMIIIKPKKQLDYLKKRFFDEIKLTEDEDSIKPLKKENNKKISSYITDNRNTDLVKFVLDEINNKYYFQPKSTSKWFILKILKFKRGNISQHITRSIGIKVGRITTELETLGIIKRYRGNVYINLYRYNLFQILEEKLMISIQEVKQ